MSSVQTPPQPALETFRYTDVDQFTKALRKFEVHFTPLARRISLRQTILNLPEFDIAVAGTFHRLVDMQLADDCTSVCFSPDRSGGVRFNGLELDRLCIGIGHGGDGFSMVENPGGQLAGVVFAPEVRDRGWPDTRGHFAAYLMTPAAQAKLAILTAEVLDFAAISPHALRSPDTRVAIKESMLSAVDQAFQPANVFRPLQARQLGKNFRIFKRVEDAIAQDLKGPIYSEALAQAVGISIRMLQDVVMQFRGVTLHRYLRLKRLWLVRRRLLAGHTSVKACALEYGFWHMGDFSKSYVTLFGEPPSRTLARGG
jgi:AraC-like DNA-binding protein